MGRRRRHDCAAGTTDTGGGCGGQRALEAAADRLFRESAQAPRGETLGEDVTSGQRRADALGLLAECALSADLDRGTAGDRFQVVLHVDHHSREHPAERPPAPGVIDAYSGHAVVEVGDGAAYVSAATYERLSCDASVVVMGHDANGTG